MNRVTRIAPLILAAIAWCSCVLMGTAAARSYLAPVSISLVSAAIYAAIVKASWSRGRVRWLLVLFGVPLAFLTLENIHRLLNTLLR
jgi:hypothetical protein